MEKQLFFIDCKNLDEVKHRYKNLALRYHPDREGGDKETMQAINLEYSLILSNPTFGFSQQSKQEQDETIIYPEIIDQIISFDLNIEICGNWIWLTGNTFPYRKKLRSIGFYFAPRKKVWYWRPREYKSLNRNSMPMDYIRHKYGSEKVDNYNEVLLTA